MKRTILQSAILIMIVTLLGRAMGLVRTIFISKEFGTTLEASAYLLAFSIPNLLFLFLPGALNAVFVPPLKRLINHGKIAEAKALFQKMVTITTIAYILIGILIWVFAKEIIFLIAANSSLELKLLATELLKIMIPSAFFIAMLSLFSSTLNVHYYFVLPTLGPIINSAIVIISIYTLVPIFGLYGLAYGTTLGFAGAAFMLLPAIYKEKYSLKPNWQWNDPEVYKIGERILPIMFGTAVSSLNEFIEKFLVSDLGDDKIAALGYARQIYQLPIAIFFGSIAIPLFIVLLDHLKNNELQSAKGTIEKGLLYMLVLMLPTTVGIWFIGDKIIMALFQRGSFDFTSTQITTSALIFFALALYPLTVKDIFVRAFYALENTFTPVLIGFVQIAIYIVAAVLLIPIMGFSGAAFGWAIGGVFSTLILGFLLWRKIGNFISKLFIQSSIKVLLSSLAMGIGLYGFNLISTTWSVYLQVLIAIILAVVIYGGMLILLKEPIAIALVQKTKRKVFRRA